MSVHICSATDPGLARSQNEDSIAFDAEAGLCILADGMGGHKAGEVASGMATAFIKSELRNSIANDGKRRNTDEVQIAIVRSIDQANGAIYTMSRTNPHYAGMGTTLVVGMFHANVLVLAHIGDSRCYCLRDNEMRQLTKDHSVIQEQRDAGLMAPDQAMQRMTGQNLVTRALGIGEHVTADINRFELLDKDIYLMCSDGLSDMVNDEAIRTILLNSETLEQKATHLVAAANAGGGRDNISVLLAQIDEAPKSGLLESTRRAIQTVWPGLKKVNKLRCAIA